MLKSLSDKHWSVLDIVNIVAGLGLFLSPWYLGYEAATSAAWNAWIVGALVALIAIGALTAFTEYTEWANVVLGVWAIVAPWVLGFSATQAATWAHVIAGIVIAELAAANVWFAHNRPLSSA